MAIDYEEIKDGELQKWDKKGIVVEGILLSYTPRQTSKGEGHVYEVKTAALILPFFAPQLLHKKLQNIPTGKIVKITYTGETQTAGGNTVKHFDVLHADPTEANLNQIGVQQMYKRVEDDKEEGEDVEGN